MKITVLIIIVFCFNLLVAIGQEVSLADTSYTIFSAYQKVKKQYPNASIAGCKSSDVTLITNQVYTQRTTEELLLDVCLPASGNDFPLVVMIHGGGWRSGNKTLMHPMMHALAGKGIAAAAIEYRLSTLAIHPAPILDIADALSFLNTKGAEWGIDNSKIILLGCSAGASLASLAATDYAHHAWGVPEVNTLINVDGVVDFTDPNESGKDVDPDKPSAAAQYLGCTYADCPEIWKNVSAVNYVDESSPTTLFINSSKARFHAGRDSYIEQLNANEIYNEVHTLRGAPHSFWLFHPWFEPTVEIISAFISKTITIQNL